MSNEVFANGREISCKSGDGKSICEFPDVCMTPPVTAVSPSGIPIPYPNTAFARDTKKGTRTVKIDNKEVMQKQKSYYKTSIGDEAGCATPAKKGIISGKIKGKMYFISWSMDVKFEGKNVDRTGDLTTHNHASPPNGAIPTADVDGVSPPTTRRHENQTCDDIVLDKINEKKTDAKKALGGKKEGQNPTAAKNAKNIVDARAKRQDKYIMKNGCDPLVERQKYLKQLLEARLEERDKCFNKGPIVGSEESEKAFKVHEEQIVGTSISLTTISKFIDEKC